MSMSTFRQHLIDGAVRVVLVQGGATTVPKVASGPVTATRHPGPATEPAGNVTEHMAARVVTTTGPRVHRSRAAPTAGRLDARA